MNNLKSVVVGIDFSPACDQALMEAQRIAQWNQSELTVTHVLDENLVKSLNRQETDLRSEITSGVESETKKHVEEVLGAKHRANVGFVVGDPFKELRKTVAHHRADLLVLGSGHAAGHIGSVASKCIRQSHCEVLLVRERQKGPFRKIVACVDFSDTSRKAAEEAFMMARQDGATLELIHVAWSINDYVAERMCFIPFLPKLLKANDAVALENVDENLSALVDPLANVYGGVESSTVILQGLDHKKTIIDHLKLVDADLVVLGKRGSNMEAVLGTTAEWVVNHAQCSVLVVNPD